MSAEQGRSWKKRKAGRVGNMNGEVRFGPELRKEIGGQDRRGKEVGAL